MSESRRYKLKLLAFDLYDIVSFLLFVGGIILFIRFFIFQPYNVFGSSMYPTLEDRDFIVVDKISSQLGNYARGDVVVFVPPGKGVAYIKRVIAFPGEAVQLRDGDVFLCTEVSEVGEIVADSCEQMTQEFLSPDVETNTSVCGIANSPQEFIVPEGGLFVMGDNRPHSTDSRCCFGRGCYSGTDFIVPYDHIIGKMLFRVFPYPSYDFSQYKAQ